MNKPIHVATSPLTGTIYAGTLLKCGNVWSSNKQDVTIEALVAVAEHTLNFGKPVEIHAHGEPEYRITVERISEHSASERYPECDTCGEGMENMPWHYATETERHLHACDNCWPAVNPARAEGAPSLEWAVARCAALMGQGFDRVRLDVLMRTFENAIECSSKLISEQPSGGGGYGHE